MTDQELVSMFKELTRVYDIEYGSTAKLMYAKVVSHICNRMDNPDWKTKLKINKKTRFGRCVQIQIPPESPVYRYIELV